MTNYPQMIPKQKQNYPGVWKSVLCLKSLHLLLLPIKVNYPKRCFSWECVIPSRDLQNYF